MTWATSNRRAQLPRDWPAIRTIVKARAGGRCEQIINGQRCTNRGSECDHAIDRHDHRPEACQWLCTDCHRDKTQAESAQARREANAKARRQPPRHPGIR